MTCYDRAKETVLLQQRLRANPVPYGHCLFMFVGIGNRKEQTLFTPSLMWRE